MKKILLAFLLLISSVSAQTVAPSSALLRTSSSLPATCAPYSIRAHSTGARICKSTGAGWDYLLGNGASLLTAGRLPYVGTGGVLADSANALLDSTGTARFAGLGVGTATTADISAYFYRSESALSGTKNTMRIDALSTISANSTNYMVGQYLRSVSHVIPVGVTDSGYRYGAQFDNYIQTASFAGTLNTQAAFVASAGILTSASTGAINTVYGGMFNIYNSTASATITNAYAVYANSQASSTGTTTNKWDFYAANSGAINYFAGNIQSGGKAFSALGTPANGTITYCSDCTKATPCAGSGNGALAKRLNGAWDCD